MAATPTIRRRMLGLKLRELRLQSGLTSEAAAERIGWHFTKMSRLESGRQGIRAQDLTRLLDIYGVADEEVREALGDLARHGKIRMWWGPYTDVLEQRYSSYIAFEAEADSMQNFETCLVPGLLQTPDYSRAITRALRPESAPDQVDALVSVRLARQNAALQREEAMNLWFIIDEATVRRLIGGPAVMAQQIRRLVELSDHPSVTLQVLANEAGAHAGLHGPFVIFGFPVQEHLDVVYVEGGTSNLYLDQKEDLTKYQTRFDRLRAAALDTGPTRDLLTRIGKQLT